MTLRFLSFFILATAIASAQTPWTLRLDGIGPAKVGMTLAQLNTALHAHFVMPRDKDDQGCFYLNPRNHPQVALMIESGHLVRVDIDKPGISTEKGLSVGDSEVRAKHVYGAELTVKPSQYEGDEGGHYLTLISGKYGLRFETEKGKITEFYAGTAEAIQYVEGCE